MTDNRIGFACKYLNSASTTKADKDANRELNTSSTTVAWLNRQSRAVAEDRLWSVANHNINSVNKVLKIITTLDPRLHMMRLSSDLLPMFTEPSWQYFWKKPDIIAWCEQEFSKIGNFARDNNIRLSFHPGQFCVLASDNSDIVRRSIEEFEYHVNMARWMGYGQTWHDHGFKINVHISGRQGPAGIISALKSMTPEARNLITIENDEMTWGLDDSLMLEKHVALVLDIHHHLLHSTGEYIQPNDSRWVRIIESWKGVRPTLHYSLSREDLLIGHCKQTLPDIKIMLETNTFKKSKLRAHSEDAWNIAQNRWALSFWDTADIMIECKLKNLGAKTLFDTFTNM